MGEQDKAVKTPFFKGVKSEFKKISWVDKTTLMKQSVAVLGVSIVVGVIISLLDTIVKYGVDILTTL